METLQGKSLSEVEALFRDAPLAPPPKGRFHGTLLHWLEAPPARHRLWRPTLALMFQLTPFGVDFDARRWFLLHHRLRLGHFEAVPRRSRWREAEVVHMRLATSANRGRARRPWDPADSPPPARRHRRGFSVLCAKSQKVKTASTMPKMRVSGAAVPMMSSIDGIRCHVVTSCPRYASVATMSVCVPTESVGWTTGAKNWEWFTGMSCSTRPDSSARR